MLQLLIVLVLSVSVLFSAQAHPTEFHNAQIIYMNEFGFDPAELEIKAGDTVYFQNEGKEDHWPASNIHPTHEEYPGFDPKHPINPGDTWEFIFTNAGEWTFHDHLNPYFTGAITVLEDKENNPGVMTLLKNFFSKSLGFLRSLLGIENKKIISEKVSKSELINGGINTQPEKKLIQPALSIPQEQNITKQTGSVQKIEVKHVPENREFRCKNTDFLCAGEELRIVTREFGPEPALVYLNYLQINELLLRSVDDHQLAHIVGRETAKEFGLTGESFLLCPMALFNGGCQHGFFEYVLGQTNSTKDAADTICQSLDNSFSSKFKFYCYHGVGHGVMMAESYDLDASLLSCDTFGEHYAREGCWQGVFMENVNAGMNGFAREGVFDNTDPLAPCNQVEDKYRHQCFDNLSGWLMRFFGNNIKMATNACLKAPQKNIAVCLESIGLMSTNPAWQITLLASLGKESLRSIEETGWALCKEFPESHRGHCVYGGLNNIMNFNELDVESGNKYCLLADEIYKKECFRLIGHNLKNQSRDITAIERECNKINNAYQYLCRTGAGI